VTLVVRRRRPLLTTLTVIAVGGLVAAGSWWFLDSERARARSAANELRQERDQLLAARDGLAREREGFARRLAILERERQVEESAYRRVGEELHTLQEEILRLEEELAFYRGIVADDSRGGGVRIQRFLVERDGQGRDFVFRLVLTRGIRSDNVASGAVTLAVDGDRSGEPLRLELQELSPLPAAPLSFSFRHFQRLEGRLRLPDDFNPRRVVVQVRAAESDERPLRRTFAWPDTQTSAKS